MDFPEGHENPSQPDQFSATTLQTRADHPEGPRRPDAALDLLIAGLIGLPQLPLDLFAAYSLGYDDGRASLGHELGQAHAEADRLYRLAMDPGQQRRIVDELLEGQRARQARVRMARGAA